MGQHGGGYPEIGTGRDEKIHVGKVESGLSDKNSSKNYQGEGFRYSNVTVKLFVMALGLSDLKNPSIVTTALMRFGPLSMTNTSFSFLISFIL
jgi:hypothetical protein